MELKWQVLNILSDGRFHSGQKLAEQLGISRSAVWKIIHGWQASGMPVDAVTGRGYRLREAFVPYTLKRLQAACPSVHWHFFEAVDSTNSFLLRNARKQGMSVCLTEEQSQGRGRRGRMWCSTPGYSLTFSFAERTSKPVSELAWLPLIAGVAVSKALIELGFENIGIKWPNDIVIKADDGQWRKLAGMLMEVSGGLEGDVLWVLGIGLNVGSHALNNIEAEYPCGTLAMQKPNAACLRHEILLAIIQSWQHWITIFWQEGPSRIQMAWEQFDVLAEQPIVVRTPDDTYHGHAMGLDDFGRLVVDTNGERKVLTAADVSIRTQQ